MMASRDTKLATSAARERRAVAREKPKEEALATAPSNAERRDVEDGCIFPSPDDVVEVPRAEAIAETPKPRRLMTEICFDRDMPDVLGARAARADIALAVIAVAGQSDLTGKPGQVHVARPKLFFDRVYPLPVTSKAPLVVMSTFVFASPRVAGSPLSKPIHTLGLSRNASSRVRRCGSVRADSTVKVCVNKECKRAGSNKTCGMFQSLAEVTGVTIEEVVCLDECGMGPNVELPDGKVVNGVKTEEDVKAVLEKISR